jgi:predicted outer membrane repeat protein
MRLRSLRRAVLEALEPRQLLSTDIVMNLNDSGTGSLRQTIASAASGDTIQFASSLSGGTLTLTSGELTIGQNVTIVGLGSANLTISGDGASTVFAISAGANVNISSLTITDGNAGLGDGGGIYNDGTLIVANCTLSSDTALTSMDTLGFSGGSAGLGGGIYNDAGGTLTISGTTITGGVAEIGGGLYNNGGGVTITGSIINNCRAVEAGGVLNTAGGTVNISSSSITSNNAVQEAGGGICNQNSNLSITAGTVSDNSASTYGGGIANFAGGTLTVNDTIVQSNTAGEGGAGIFNFTGASLTVYNNSFITGNTTGGYFGGGLLNYEGSVTIIGSTVSGNVSTFVGAGAADFEGTFNVTSSNFTANGNSAAQAGGGLYVFGDAASISSSTFSSNQAQYGAAIYDDSGASLAITSSTFSNNTAIDYGGAVYVDGTTFISNSTISGNHAAYGAGLISFGTLTCTNTTIANNVASSSGGGIYIVQDNTTIYNTIVANNTLTSHSASDITGTLDRALATGQTHSSNNLIGTGGSGGLTNGSRGNIVGATITLGTLQNNGGPTSTMALPTGSPAINAGSNALAVNSSGAALTTDQRGTGYPRIVSNTVDIGAYEVQTSSPSNVPAVVSPSPAISASNLAQPSLLTNQSIATPDFINLGLLYSADGTANPSAAAGSSAPYDPAQVRAAYGVDAIDFDGVIGDGTGQTIAIVDAYNDPDIISDANAFSAQFGLPQFNGTGEPTLQVLNQTGGSSLPGNSTPGQWDMEESLDVEWAHAIAPMANIILFEANSSADSDLYTAVTTAASYAGVSVVSMSFSTPQLIDFYSGVSEPSDDSIFTTPGGHQGVTFLSSTGDNGAPDGGYPALSPNVVAVGGTTLQIASDGTYLGESAWNGGGGGLSLQELQPGYQSTSINDTGLRATPDVSMDADPETGVYVLDSFDGGYNQIGGTSLSTPMWAALIAIVNQGRALRGQGSLNGASQTLPMLYSLPSTDFHDVATGNNGYPATIGYDLATGLGSPVASLLVPALAGFASMETWTGVISNDWFTPGNWNTDMVPVSTSNVIINFGSPVADAAFTVESLTINGGTLHLGVGGGAYNVTSLILTGAGSLDIGNDRLFINYEGNSDPISTIISDLAAGYNAGAWNGIGIDTSDLNSAYGLGYADSSDPGNPAGLSPHQIEIAYTLYGDTNLDGEVNSTDFGVLAANFGQSGKTWGKGDFDYNGTINSIDFGMLAGNFGKSAGAAAVELNVANLVATVVPAPTGQTQFVLLAEPMSKASLTDPPFGGGPARVASHSALPRFRVLRENSPPMAPANSSSWPKNSRYKLD